MSNLEQNRRQIQNKGCKSGIPDLGHSEWASGCCNTSFKIKKYKIIFITIVGEFQFSF
jgi:hypothetical protein